MFPRGRRPLRLRPNWWTILPLLANAALWMGIVYVGARAKSMLDDKAATAIYATASDESEASSRKQSEGTDCSRPGCAAPAPGAAATPSR
jgi:hypothetical protein